MSHHKLKRIAIVGGGLLILSSLFGCGPDSSLKSPAVPSTDHIVVVRNMQFSPATLKIKPGDTVEWKNEDITPHTATSPSFDSGLIAADQSWKHTFTKTGNFPYGCTFHPDMKGTVVVE